MNNEICTMNKARTLKAEMKGRRKSKASLKDICILIEAHDTGEFHDVYDTVLYVEHGSEYCEFLSLLYKE